jgi:ribosome maturation factor RimP
MDRDALIAEFKIFLNDFLKTRDLDLIDVIHRYEGRDLVLRLLVDKPDGGITLGECALLNRELGNIMDEKNILQERCILEVSSPGLDRPLATENDFRRSLNKNVKFLLNENISGKLEWDGIVKSASSEKVNIETAGGNLEIPLAKINKAKPII